MILDTILSCIIGIFIAGFGVHTYDQAHMEPKGTQQQAQKKPDRINIYVGEANHYSLLKEEGEVKVWTPPS